MKINVSVNRYYIYIYIDKSNDKSQQEVFFFNITFKRQIVATVAARKNFMGTASRFTKKCFKNYMT